MLSTTEVVLNVVILRYCENGDLRTEGAAPSLKHGGSKGEPSAPIPGGILQKRDVRAHRPGCDSRCCDILAA